MLVPAGSHACEASADRFCDGVSGKDGTEPCQNRNRQIEKGRTVLRMMQHPEDFVGKGGKGREATAKSDDGEGANHRCKGALRITSLKPTGEQSDQQRADKIYDASRNRERPARFDMQSDPITNDSAECRTDSNKKQIDHGASLA